MKGATMIMGCLSAALAWLSLCTVSVTANVDDRFFRDDWKVKMFDGVPVQITAENHEEILQTYHYLFVDFYADWCPYCRGLKPTWEEVAHNVKGVDDAAMAMLDCVAYPDLARRYGISKFPTMKMIRGGEASKKEYRGARTTEALTTFFHGEIDEETNHAKTASRLEELVEEGDKRIIVGFFTSQQQSKERIMFEQMSDHMRDDCKFIEVNDPAVLAEYKVEDGTILYKTDRDHDLDEVFKPPHDDGGFDLDLMSWAFEKCVPLVKEVTHANVEGLAEEGKPFFILFYDDQEDDGTSVRIFKNTIERRFESERNNFNFLYADGNVFTHPIKHMGLSKKDMPIVAIDTFSNMYRFGNFRCFGVPEKLQQFVDDFKAGTLHRNMLMGQYHPYECDTELDEVGKIAEHIKVQVRELKDIDSHDDDTKEQLNELEHLAILSDGHEKEKKEKEEMKQKMVEHGVDPDSIEQELDQRVHDSVFASLKPGAGSGRYSIRDEL